MVVVSANGAQLSPQATWKAEIRRITAQVKKFARPHLNRKKLGVVWFMLIIPVIEGRVK
jgi:hypothetical protein